MPTFVVIMLCVAANHVVGSLVWACLDNEDEALYKWVGSAPLFIPYVCVQAWPVAVWYLWNFNKPK